MNPKKIVEVLKEHSEQLLFGKQGMEIMKRQKMLLHEDLERHSLRKDLRRQKVPEPEIKRRVAKLKAEQMKRRAR